MSTVFEAFLVNVIHTTKEKVESFIKDEKIEIPLGIIEIQEEEIVGLLVDLPRNEFFNHERNEKIALKLANKFKECLLVYWDDRVGLSLAMLYRQNGLVEEFSEKDEIWLELKENGYPNFQGLKYSCADIKNNSRSFDEFVCVFNSIDAALYSFYPLRQITCVGLIEKICYSD